MKPLLCLVFLILHPFYVGLMDIAYFEESHTYGISVKLFTDDLEKAVERDSDIKLKLATEKEHSKSDSLIAGYVLEHVGISGIQPLKLTYLGKEYEYDVTWIYLESEPTEPIRNLRVDNDILMEVFPDQTHVIHFELNGEVLSDLLHAKKRTATFNP